MFFEVYFLYVANFLDKKDIFCKVPLNTYVSKHNFKSFKSLVVFWHLLDLVRNKIEFEWCRPRYFVAISCDEPIQPGASASVVQWLDSKDTKVSKLVWNMVMLAALTWQNDRKIKVHLAFSPYPKMMSPLGGLVKCKDVFRKVPLHLALADVVLHLQDPVNNSSIHIYMNPLMKTMLQGEPAKLCAKEQLCHTKVSFLRGGQGGPEEFGTVGLLALFFIQFCIQAKGRQLAMSLQAAAQYRVWCSLADPKICTVPTHQLQLITSLPHVFFIWPGAPNPLEILEIHTLHSLMHESTSRLTRLSTRHHPVASSPRLSNGWHLLCRAQSPRNGWLCISNAQAEWWISSQQQPFG